MTLSPAAQKVIDAWHRAADGEYINGVWTPNRNVQIAAALRAAVEQSIQPDPLMGIDCIIYARDLLAIATELETPQ